MKKYFILSLIFLFVVTANAEWDKKEKILAGTYVALQIVDIGQTINALKHGAVEANPVYGKNLNSTKLYLIKGIGLVLMYFVLDNLTSEFKKPVLYILNSMQLGVVTWNGIQPGVGLKLSF